MPLTASVPPRFGFDVSLDAVLVLTNAGSDGCADDVAARLPPPQAASCNAATPAPRATP
ncbi:MAG: hypothetical protein U0531_17495 [Dehalococcoidia bacterium]